MEGHFFFSRLGRKIAGPRGKWLTVAIWVILVAVLSVLAPSVASMENNNAADLPNTSPSVVAANLASKAYPSHSGTPALLVFYAKGGLSNTDLQRIANLTKVLHQHPLPAQTSVVPLYAEPSYVLAQFESKDKTTLTFPVTLSANASTTVIASALTQLQTDATHVFGVNPFSGTTLSGPGLHARVTGPAGIAVDATALFKGADFALLGATSLLVLILLVVLYRSPLLPFIPLLCVGIAYGVISAILGLLAKWGWIVVDAQGISIMTVLLFGAGTDYCLFLVARYREALFSERDRHQAISQGLGGAGGAIAMSGLTVVLSLATLLFAEYGAFHRFAVPFSVAVLVMAVAGLTLVPALLAIVGRAAFFPFVPRTPDMESALAARATSRHNRRKHSQRRAVGKFGETLGTLVSRRPWTVLVIAVVLLGALAVTSTGIKYTYSLIDSFPKTMPSRQGFTLLAQHMSPGDLAPVSILVTGARPPAAVKLDLERDGAVDLVTGPVQSKTDAAVYQYQVTLDQNPYSLAAMAQLPQLQAVVVHALHLSGAAAARDQVLIGGQTATQYDTKQVTDRDARVIIPIVLLLIFIMLFVYLRSLVAAVYLIATVLLSYFAALGTGWLFLHEVLGDASVNGSIPLYAFVFLVALGEDYNIFMVSRIWQERGRRSLRDAVAYGVSRTSSVITSAGLILAGTFAVLAVLPIQILVQFGAITAIGVLLDTFIVRPLLVPAITVLLGRAAFWPQQVSPTQPDALVSQP